MGRLIIEGITLWIIFQVLRGVFRGHRRSFEAPTSSPAGTRQMMVQCHHCQDYIPADRAIHARGHTYCSEEHRRADGSA